MRAINLIPPEDRRGERAPLRTGPLAYLLVGVLFLAFGGVYMLVSANNSVTDGEARVAVLEQDLEASQARAEALRSFTDFASLEQARTETVSGLATSRFDWERVLRELAHVMPAGVTLGDTTGSILEGDGADAASIAAPHIKLTGCATGQETVAQMVAAFRDIDGVTRVGLAKSIIPGLGASADASGSSDSGKRTALGCSRKQTTDFEVTIAFDEVQVDDSAGGIVQPEPPAPDPAAEAAAAQQAGQDAIGSAEDKSRKAVDTLVPGA